MIKMRKIGLLGLMAMMLMGSPVVFGKGDSARGHGAGMSSGFSHGEKEGWKDGSTPPGWSKGKKTGWHGAKTPPGLTNSAEAETAKKDQ